MRSHVFRPVCITVFNVNNDDVRVPRELPIHLALGTHLKSDLREEPTNFNEVNPAIIELLLERYPESANTHSKHHKLPLHMLLTRIMHPARRDHKYDFNCQITEIGQEKTEGNHSYSTAPFR